MWLLYSCPFYNLLLFYENEYLEVYSKTIQSSWTYLWIVLDQTSRIGSHGNQFKIPQGQGYYHLWSKSVQTTKHLFKECSHNLSSHYWHGCALQQKEINVAGNNPPLIRKLSSLDQTHNIKAFLSEMGWNPFWKSILYRVAAIHFRKARPPLNQPIFRSYCHWGSFL